jgi:cobalt/nickel transport protein
MKIKNLITAGIIGLIMAANPAFAHFQMIYTPEAAMEKGSTIDMKLVFTHPFEAGHTMDMGTPESFKVLHKKKTTDLAPSLKPITWKSLTNSGKAYETSYKLRGMGDWIFSLTPAPYYEASEDIYIQQITKTIVNVGGSPTDWDAEVGLPAEIVPLDKPYAIWTGSTFRGIVTSKGKPVPFAEIEVEYMNHEPIMDSNSFAKEAKAKAPQDSFITMGIKSNAFGEFSFGIPKAGWWGFCAMGVGPVKEYKGKELSQDAVIWVNAQDMK